MADQVMRADMVMGIPTLRRYDLLLGAVRSALTGSTIPRYLLVIDNGGRLPAHIQEQLAVVADTNGVGLSIHTPGRNLGVAASWNIVADNAGLARYILLANDDTVCYPGTIASLVEAAFLQPEELFFFPASGGYKNAWSFFLQRAESWASIGPYDESISPGYGFFEDNDMSYRLQLVGRRHVPVPRCGYGHTDSATVKSMSQSELAIHWQRFGLAKANYIAKWGGEPGRERYRIPYNGERIARLREEA